MGYSLVTRILHFFGDFLAKVTSAKNQLRNQLLAKGVLPLTFALNFN